MSADPKEVEVIGPESAVRRVTEALTEPVSVSGARDHVRQSVILGLIDPSLRLKNARAATVTVQIVPAPLERSNILIVDDRLDKRVVFRTILEELDQNIVTASSGEEALRWLLDNDCAVILLDVNMPGMDGLETAELIRSRRKSAHTPIIFITAFADEMHTARGYSLGAVDYILSPVVPNILRSKVKALVQLHRLTAEVKKRSDERVALVNKRHLQRVTLR